MLFTLLIITLFTLGIIFFIIARFLPDNSPQEDGFLTLGAGFSVISGFVLILCIIMLSVIHLTIEADILSSNSEAETLQAEYEYIQDQDENYLTHMDLSEFYDEVRYHNQYITRKQYWADNLWFNWYNPQEWKNAEKVNLHP